MWMTALIASAALAQDLTLEVDGVRAEGEAVTFTVGGADPGQDVYLLAGRGGSSCPAQTVDCLDIANPRVYQRLVADASGVASVSVVVPAFLEGKVVQAATRDAISDSAEMMQVVIITGTPDLTFTGIVPACDTDQADLMVEYIGEAQGMVATGYVAGAPVVSHSMDLLPGATGAVFLWAEAIGVEAPSCDDITWVYEGESFGEVVCAVQGPDRDTVLGLQAHDCVPF